MRYKILRKVIFLLFLFLYTASASEARLTPLDLPQFSKIYSNILNQLIDDVFISETNFVRASFLPIQERNVSNAVTREYIWGLSIGGGIGGLLNFKQNGMDYAYLYDGKGNVSNVIDSTQSVISSQDIPMVDFVYVTPMPNGEINLTGTLRTKKDITKIIELAKKTEGIKKVIREYIEDGYGKYKAYSIENKKKIYKHLSEYLFYENKLDPNIVRQVEIFKTQLVKDIEK